MAKKPETLFKERIQPLIDRLPNTFSIKTQEVSRRGVPDIFICCNGVFIALELKRGIKETLMPLQKWNIAKITKAGGIAMGVSPETWATTYNLLRDVAKKGHKANWFTIDRFNHGYKESDYE